ncbi:uncharacterized protein LW93_1496 [Fusarium fujikuroi]|nr:uncharacterized protein LW93_1496 [Fusarium fujikuroi]
MSAERTDGRSNTPQWFSLLQTNAMSEVGFSTYEGREAQSGKQPDCGPTDSTASASFQSLVDRSIQAWEALNYVGCDRVAAIKSDSAKLRDLTKFDDLLAKREFWFFQLRKSFLEQQRLAKWNPNRLDQYILLPISYGYVNNKDCYFVSHYWREQGNPDPAGVDLAAFKNDLASDSGWLYIWVDWTCMPQGNCGKRSDLENYYFKMMLQCIPMLIRDCAFEWRFPSFQARAWVLYELAEYVLTHAQHTITDDNKHFVDHIREMVALDVKSTVQKYEYKCTNESDMRLVTGWLEILVLMARIFPDDIASRQVVLDNLNRPSIGTFSSPAMGLKVDKAKGILCHKGYIYRFTPVFHVRSHVSAGC